MVPSLGTWELKLKGQEEHFVIPGLAGGAENPGQHRVQWHQELIPVTFGEATVTGCVILTWNNH